MKNFKATKLTKYLILTLVLCLIVGVLAYFSDRTTGTASIATLDNAVDIVPEKDPSVTPDNPNVDPDDYDGTDNDEFDPNDNDEEDYLTNWWAYINSTAIANYNPGDKIDLSYILENRGELDVITRETFIITSDVAMDTSAPEFALYKSVQSGTYGGYAGKDAVVWESISANQIKYVITGDATNAILAETGAVEKDYYVVFSEDATNKFQGATCSVYYLVEAMQADGDWATVITAAIPFAGGSINAVPEA